LQVGSNGYYRARGFAFCRAALLTRYANLCVHPPCIPTKAAKVPDRPEWLHEIKHEGYRLIVQREAKRGAWNAGIGIFRGGRDLLSSKKQILAGVYFINSSFDEATDKLLRPTPPSVKMPESMPPWQHPDERVRAAQAELQAALASAKPQAKPAKPAPPTPGNIQLSAWPAAATGLCVMQTLPGLKAWPGILRACS
jgi:hypothetical protein